MPHTARWFQIMGIAKRAGQCLTGIYSNLDELNIKIFIKFSRSVPGKLIKTKKPPFHKSLYKSFHQLTRPFATASNSSLVGWNGIWWFPGNQLEANQPITFNLDDGVYRPVLPHNQILCLHNFNLRSFNFQSLQSLPSWIQLRMLGTLAICIPFQWINNGNNFFCSSLLLGQLQIKLFYCGKGRQNFPSNVTLYPYERSRQNHLDWILKMSHLLGTD